MSVARVGSTEQYADNWNKIFGGGKKKTAKKVASTAKSTKKKAAKVASTAKSTKKKAAKKTTGAKKTKKKAAKK